METFWKLSNLKLKALVDFSVSYLLFNMVIDEDDFITYINNHPDLVETEKDIALSSY
jgi:hypothetical protein